MKAIIKTSTLLVVACLSMAASCSKDNDGNMPLSPFVGQYEKFSDGSALSLTRELDFFEIKAVNAADNKYEVLMYGKRYPLKWNSTDKYMYLENDGSYLCPDSVSTWRLFDKGGYFRTNINHYTPECKQRTGYGDYAKQ